MDEECLNVVGTLIPRQAYLYFPSLQDQRTYLHGKLIRYFFYGHVEHEEMEKKKLEEFYAYVQKEKLQVPNKNYYNDQRMVQILSGNNFEPKKTYKAVLLNREWRKQYLPPQLSDKQKQILSKGYVYVSGRDRKWRPIIVIQQAQLQFDKVEEYFQAAVFAFEYIINNMFLPGQIENWIFIYDLKDLSLFRFPFQAAKKILGVLSSNYGGKLFREYIVNTPNMAWLAWKTVSPWIDPVTIQKIKLDNGIECVEKHLFLDCDKNQVEEKYGGTQPNRTLYWPLTLPEPQFDQSLLLSEKEYKEMYINNQLERNFISPHVDSM